MIVNTYQEALQYLNSRLPMFFRDGATAVRPGLKNIQCLCKRLGSPEKKLTFVHVGGTNGKGSVSNILNAVLQKAGYKTGLYTSPHLVDFKERILVQNRMIEEDYIIDFVNNLPALSKGIDPSFFEITVIMAFDYFYKQQVDVAVVEVGMGGRLDSTNVVHPILSVITNVSLDHTQFLGHSIEEIAYEKSKIIKGHSTAVVGKHDEQSATIFTQQAVNKNADISFADKEYNVSYVGDKHYRLWNEKENHMFVSDLTGDFQSENLRTSFVACKKLKENGLSIETETFFRGVKQVRLNQAFKARWEKVASKPDIFLDIAHNVVGVDFVFNEVAKIAANYASVNVLFGFVKDKDWKKILRLFPTSYTYFATQSLVNRALPVEELYQYCVPRLKNVHYFETVQTSMNALTNMLKEDELLVVFGSAFLIGEVLEILKQKNE